jgi:hypothetical protein
MRCALSRETRCSINGVGRSNLKGIDMNPQLILPISELTAKKTSGS